LWPRTPIASGTVEKPGDDLELPAGAAGRRKVIVQAELATKGDDLVTAYIEGTSPPVVARLKHVSPGKKTRGSVHARVSTVRQDVIVAPGTSALTLTRIDGTERPLRVELVPRRPVAALPTILRAIAAFLSVVVIAARGGLPDTTIPIAGTALGFALLVRGDTSSSVRALLLGVFVGAPAGLMLGLLVGWPALKLLAPAPASPRRRRGGAR
jgi:hypothetical protein